jgi:prepilin-type N-terminal cleavage/methylation domain-containing protein
MFNQNLKGFTLIELLIVLALIAILASVLIVTIKPGAIFSKARDTKRINDLKNIEKIMDALYSTEQNFTELNYASSNIVYISLPDSSSTCGSYLSQLPPLPSGWSYHCSATPTSIDGTGWIPIPFSNFPILNISQLFIDPLNQPPYYYSFVVGGSYKVTAKPEENYYPAINDGGIEPLLYEVGTDKKLSTFQSGLVDYWSFDEGTGTIAYDYSGNNNNGTLYNGPTWITGKVGNALSFDGVDDQFYKQNPNGLPANNAPQSIVAWVYHARGNVIESILVLANPSASSAIQLGSRANNVFSVWSWGGGVVGGGILISDPNPLPLNVWTHWVYTYDGTKHRLYRNGVLVASSTEVPQSAVPSLLMVSGFNINSSEQFLGSIDEVRLYNRVLSDSEIKVLYDATK